MSKIVVTQKKSTIGQCKKNRVVLKSMGLRYINHSKTYSDNNCIRGMINKISHLVSYKLVD